MDTRKTIKKAPESSGPADGRGTAGSSRTDAATASHRDKIIAMAARAIALTQGSRGLSRMLRHVGLILLVAKCLGNVAADAWNASWLLNPGSSDWNTAANWAPVLVPTGTATFGASNTTTITFSKNASVDTLNFLTGAPAYSFDLSGFLLTVKGTGIVDGSSNAPAFSAAAGNSALTFAGKSTAGDAIITNDSHLVTSFLNTSTSGSATITNNSGGSTVFRDASHGGGSITNNSGGSTLFFNTSTFSGGIINDGGLTQFADSSTSIGGVLDNRFDGETDFFGNSSAGNTFIIDRQSQRATAFFDTSTAANSEIELFESNLEFNNASTAGNATINNNGRGGTTFSGTSSAENATITNTNDHASTGFFDASTAAKATITNDFFGSTGFGGTSTAANSSITNNAFGSTRFGGKSTAGNAIITTNDGGLVAFTQTATGGKARFITNAGGIFDISSLTSAGMTTGSIEGAGSYQLGSKKLTVGLNNLSTEVSGIITDGGIDGGTGGSLVKVGRGTLTLTGADTYTGGTTVLAGKLQLGNAGAAGSIEGPVLNSGTFEIFKADTSNITTITNNGGTTRFDNNSTAGEISIINNSGGNTRFQDTSTAGNATITTNAGGTTRFYDRSTGGAARFITNTGGRFDISTLFIGGLTVGSIEGTGSYLLGFKRLTVGLNNLSTEVSGTIADGGVVNRKGGSLIKVGSGTLTLAGTDTYTGGTTISQGALQLGDAGAKGSIVGAVVNSSLFDIFNANTAGITSIINNSGGSTVFENANSAGGASITNNLKGETAFLDASTAADSTITTHSGGLTSFATMSKAGNAFITNTSGGSTHFTDASSADAATITNTGGVTQFVETSSAANSIITNNTGGETDFFGKSTAGTAIITNNAGSKTIFNDTSTAERATITNSNGGHTVFLNTSTAGNATIANSKSNGFTTFFDTSTAGHALITNNWFLDFHDASTAGDATILNKGKATEFFSKSSAGNAVITNTNGGTIRFFDMSAAATSTIINSGSTIYFNGTSTAGHAGITNNSAGNTRFQDMSTAGDATITTNSGGTTRFYDKSTGGEARFITNLGGRFDISTLFIGAMTAGSIEGAGSYFLGFKKLTVGLNNLSTEVSGTIADGGVVNRKGGSLIKVGTGTLTLTGLNTYSGGTSFNGGILAVNLDANLGTGPLRFDGGTLEALFTSGDGTSGISSTKTITLNTGGTFLADAGTASTLGGTIGGIGLLTKDGPGTLTLTRSNSFGGGTNIHQGTLVAAGNNALGSGPVELLGSTLVIPSGVTLPNLVNIAQGGILDNSGTLNNSVIDAPAGTEMVINSGTINGNVQLGGSTDIVHLFNGSKIAGSLALSGTSNSTLILDGTGPQLLSMAVTGTLTNNGMLVKQGSGTWTVDRDLAAPLGTEILAGTLVVSATLTTPQVDVSTGAHLQLNSGGSIGNLVNNGSLIFGSTKPVNYGGVISGPGNVIQSGLGTTTLSGRNTYSGGTVINLGTLTVDNLLALGTGDVTVNRGILRANRQSIHVLGNYTQKSGGTLQLQVAGANPGQYDSLSVGGNATLGGKLQLISLGFEPKAGNQLTLVTTGGTVSGRFAQFVDPFQTGSGFNTVNLVYSLNSVLLEFLNLARPTARTIATTNFASFALTPKEVAPANLLSAVQLDPRAENLISFVNQEPFADLPADFEKITPEGLTAFYEISFSNANIQRLNLEGRLDDIHYGSNGFNSNMKINGATVNLEVASDGKSSKGVVEPILQPGPENRWGVWVTGFGDFVNVDSEGNAKGYDFTTGGVSLGVDYRITDQLAIGVMGEYSHTWTSLQPSGHIDVDSGRGGLYATWYHHGIYLNGAIYGGHNNYDSSRTSLGGQANGGTEGAEWSTFVGGGYDFHFGHLTAGPIAALQYTYVNVNGFSEHGSLAPMQIHSDSAESLRSDVGLRLFYQWQIGKVVLEPSLKAAWEHEYKYSALPITAGFVGIPGPAATFFGPSEGHDSAVVSAGVSVQLTPTLTTYVNYDGQLGRQNYDSNAVTGGVRISF